MRNLQSVSFADFIKERKEKYEPDDESIFHHQKIEKIDFSQGKIHLGKYKPTKTKQIIVEPNDFVFSGLNIEKGAVSINDTGERLVVSANYSTCEVDYTVINKEYLSYFMRSPIFKSLLKDSLKKDYGFTRPKHLMPLMFFIPKSLQEQKEVIIEFQRHENESKSLLSEITVQHTLLKNLRQRILQEAIEGKLTSDWRQHNPDIEPANELLARIQKEKEQLIKDEKIKKQSPLPPINTDEKTFELPENWVCCRLGNYTLFERGKFSIRPRNDPSCFGGDYPFIQIGSLDSTGSVVTSYNQTLNDKGLAASKMFEKGTIMVAIVGGTIGNLGVLGANMCFPDSMVGVRPNQFTCQDYILMLLQHYQPLVRELSYQMAGQPNIKLPTLNNLICALPPIPEQKAIVIKVKKLLTLCDKLESQITNNQAHAEQLMQAVLKEAFQQNSNKPELVGTYA